MVEGFRGVVLVLDDGRVLSGLAAKRSDDVVTLVDLQGQRIEVPRASIESERILATSPMPSGLAAGLKPDEFCDLIAYLETLRAAGQASPGAGTGEASLPAQFQRRQIAAGITGATALAVVPDGRALICEQTGALRIVVDDQLRDEPFAALPVDDQWERGLIGVTVDPQFAENHFVYVLAVLREPYPHHAVCRFTAAGDRAAPERLEDSVRRRRPAHARRTSAGRSSGWCAPLRRRR